MSQYLRDEFIKNLTLSEEALRKINGDIIEIQNQVNQALNIQYPNQENNETKINKLLVPSYIIRFDGRGFHLFEFEKMIRYFQDAKRVERIIFMLQSFNSLKELIDKSINLRLDALEPDKCQLVVKDVDCNWVDAVFCKLKERLSRYRNKHFIIQNRWVPFIVQIVGVILGLFVSLWAATKISPRLTIDNPLAFAFVIVFLLFSNVWTFLYKGIMRTLNYFYPSISFKEKRESNWLIKDLITALISIFSIFVLGQAVYYFSKIVKSIIK